MRLTRDHRTTDLPLFHLVAESNPCPGGEAIETLCRQSYVCREFYERDVASIVEAGDVCLHCRFIWRRNGSE